LKEEFSDDKKLNYKLKGVIMADLKYEITNELAVLSESARGWTKEINMVSWNDREPKVDIREWSPEHERMGKGVTLSTEEAKLLRDVLNRMDL
jgi:hypothetical protein